jgi:hypothetical protein
MVREPGEEEPPDVALLERGPALTWLDKALDSAWRSFGQLVAVVGEAGIGKTSLLRCFGWACAGHHEPLGSVRSRPARHPSARLTRWSCSVGCAPGAAIPTCGRPSIGLRSSHGRPASAAARAGGGGPSRGPTARRRSRGSARRDRHRVAAGSITGDRWLAGELAVLSSRADAAAEVLDGPSAEPYQRYLSGDVEGAAARWEEMGCVYEAADALADSDNPAAVSSALDTLQLLGARP